MNNNGRAFLAGYFGGGFIAFVLLNTPLNTPMLAPGWAFDYGVATALMCGWLTERIYNAKLKSNG